MMGVFKDLVDEIIAWVLGLTITLGIPAAGIGTFWALKHQEIKEAAIKQVSKGITPTYPMTRKMTGKSFWWEK